MLNKPLIGKSLALKVINEALKSGADFAELYVQSKFSHSVSLAHKRVDNCSSSLGYGASIRLMEGTKCVFGYTSDLTSASLLKLASDLASSFSSGKKLELNGFDRPLIGKPKVKIYHEEKSDEEIISYLKKGEDVIYKYSPNIVDCTCGIIESDEKVEIFNSEKKHVLDRRVRTRLVCSAVASKDNIFQTGFEGPGGSLGLELLDQVDYVKLAEGVAKDAVDLLSAPECPSGKMDVIIGNSFGGVLFHEACGHPLEGTSISHNTSVFSGKLNEKIASDVVTAIDDGTISNAWGSSAYDDEGNQTTKNVLIKDGVLVNYMVDRFDGRRMNMPSTGSCRRQSYKYLPTTRMTNTYIANGKSSVEDIIKNTEFGLYCVSFSGGSVDPSTDKFNFTASKAYIVKNGKIDHLVRDATLIGYGYEVLKNIDMVGNDLKRGQGMCGAASGSIPVEVGQPTLRVKNMTVGGRGGNL